MNKLLGTYIVGMSSYGFYRGFNNKYPNNYVYNYKIDQQNDSLYTDRLGSGLLSSAYHICPFYQFHILYNIIRRTEKVLRKKELVSQDWEY